MEPMTTPNSKPNAGRADGSGLRRFLLAGAIIAATAAGLAPLELRAESIFSHVHNRVPEGQQDAAAEWYLEIFGGEPGERGPGPGVDLPNGFLGSMPFEGLAGDGSASVIDHIGMYVQDVEAAVGRLRELGGEVYEGPITHPAGFRLARVRDPWGARYELMEMPERSGFDHVHLFLSEAEAACGWFQSVFGGERDENRSQAGFVAIRYEGFWVHCTQLENGDTREPSQYRVTDHFGFDVPSLDELRQKLDGSGYEPYLERPNPPGPDLMFIHGPGGVHLEISGPASMKIPAKSHER